MANQDLFDPSLYARAPIISMSSGISLARALLSALPTGMPAAVKKAATQLDEITDAAEGVWVQRQRADQAAGEGNTRAVDLLADQAWAAIRGRLENYALLPVEDFPLSPRAAELGQTLFGEGLGFLKASYPEQSATTSALLRRIDEDRLSKDLDAICGPEFLRNVRKQQPRYEAMVAATLKREAGGPDLNPQLRGLARAIVGYAIKVAASVEDDDQKTVDRARAALRPLDTFRANNPPTERAAKSPTPAAEPAAPTAGKSGSEDPEAA